MCNEICPPNSTQHVVKKGDTLWRLSQTYGVSLQSIFDLNPGVDPQNLQIGSTLCIPTASTPAPSTPTPSTPSVTCPEGAFSYTVQAGDTLWRLSRTYGVSLQSIFDLNPGIDPQNLQIGSTLCIPTASAPAPSMPMPPTPSVTCPEGAFAYTIQSGDTLWRLSQTYGVSLQSIFDLNPGVDPQNLQIGSTLCIPTASAPAPSTPMPSTPAPTPTPSTPAPAPTPTPSTPMPSTPPTTCPEGAFSYTVRAGDTLWKLSQTYGVCLQSIFDLNPGVDPQNLQIGSTLCIPTAPAPAPPTQPVTCPQGAFSHTVRAGDTLWRLSQTYGVSLQSIFDLNPDVDPQNLQIGSTLCIPTAPAPAPPTPPITCPQGAFSHTVRAGDTLWRLSQTYGVSLQSIFDLNPDVDPQNLQIGSTLCIPTAPAPTPPTPPVTCPQGAFSHTVRAGDTLWRLSQTYGVSLQSIFDLNPDVDPQNLQIGSTLCIPTAPAPVPVPTPTPTPAPVPTPVPTPTPAPSTPSAPCDFAYLIRKCDSICGIARKFHVSVDSILQNNPGIDPRCLQAGTYIYVPINCCEGNTCRYMVRAGDTLNSIANKFNICPSDLVAANPNIDFQCLVKCQVICIPNT